MVGQGVMAEEQSLPFHKLLFVPVEMAEEYSGDGGRILKQSSNDQEQIQDSRVQLIWAQMQPKTIPVELKGFYWSH